LRNRGVRTAPPLSGLRCRKWGEAHLLASLRPPRRRGPSTSHFKKLPWTSLAGKSRRRWAVATSMDQEPTYGKKGGLGRAGVNENWVLTPMTCSVFQKAKHQVELGVRGIVVRRPRQAEGRTAWSWSGCVPRDYNIKRKRINLKTKRLPLVWRTRRDGGRAAEKMGGTKAEKGASLAKKKKGTKWEGELVQIMGSLGCGCGCGPPVPLSVVLFLWGGVGVGCPN